MKIQNSKFKAQKSSKLKLEIRIDGNFEWMHIHLTNEANRNRIVRASWFIVAEQGEIEKGFEDYRFKAFTEGHEGNEEDWGLEQEETEETERGRSLLCSLR